MRKTSLLILCISAVAICAAADPPFQEWVGKTAKAIHTAHLYRTAPKGLFCSSGAEIDTVQLAEHVRILDYSKVSCALFFAYEYLEIQRISPRIPPEKQRGFVRATDDGEPRFKLMPEP